MDSEMVFWLSFYGVFFIASSAIGALKGRLIAGLLLGYVLGPVGLVIILLSKDKRMLVCPHCSEKTHRHSYYCQHCERKVYGCLQS